MSSFRITATSATFAGFPRPMTPADVHFGRAGAVLAQRQAALDAAYANNPDRFVNGPPRVQQLPAAVWINKPKPEPDPPVEEAQ